MSQAPSPYLSESQSGVLSDILSFIDDPFMVFVLFLVLYGSSEIIGVKRSGWQKLKGNFKPVSGEHTEMYNVEIELNGIKMAGTKFGISEHGINLRKGKIISFYSGEAFLPWSQLKLTRANLSQTFLGFKTGRIVKGYRIISKYDDRIEMYIPDSELAIGVKLYLEAKLDNFRKFTEIQNKVKPAT